MLHGPEQIARQTIDAMLAAGWAVQAYKAFDPSASTGIALREVPLNSGRCDYLLLVNRRPIGVVEAKKEGTTLSTVADQSPYYAANLPDFLAAGLGSDSLPFHNESRAERDRHAKCVPAGRARAEHVNSINTCCPMTAGSSPLVTTSSTSPRTSSTTSAASPSAPSSGSTPATHTSGKND